MKHSISCLTCFGFAAAFPSVADIKSVRTSAESKRQAPIAPTPFDAAAQLVSTTGEHAFQAPGPNDARGPCPALNAASNHGYLSRNGAVPIPQFITGLYEAYGMAADLSGFLAVYGAVFTGNLLGWSIGGPTPEISTIGLLGEPTGISGSHNKYEGDGSPIRGDLYIYGNDYLSQIENFELFYSMQAGKTDDEVNFDLNVLTAFRKQRFDHSVQNNPYFFNGPFSGGIAEPAAYAFVYRLLANKSAEYPDGRLDRNTLKTFYAIEGEPGNFKYTPGHERIPDNFYKRNDADQYTIPYYARDALTQALTHPEFLSIGGNTGKVNTFTGVDLNDLTKGVFDASTLTQGNNLICFGFQASLQGQPDMLEGIFTNVTQAKSLLSDAIANATHGLGCPQLTSLQYKQFGIFPGYSQDYNGYAAPRN